MSVPLGFVDGLPRLSPPDVMQLIEANRRAYCAPIADVNRLLEAPKPTTASDDAEATATAPKSRRRDAQANPNTETNSPTESTKPNRDSIRDSTTQSSSAPFLAPALPGKGGRQHKYLQHLTKRLAEENGFRAVIEEAILDRTGQVDVALYRGDLKIGCEISVTTGSDQELRDVEKCFAAGFTRVLVIADESRHLASLRRALEAGLDEKDLERLTFCSGSQLAEVLQAAEKPVVVEQTVRGYRVRVKSGKTTSDDATLRRKAIADVIARSLTKTSTR